MNSDDVERALMRISHQIVEKNHGTEGLCLIGIKTRGVPLAYRLQENIRRIENVEPPVGTLDISLYRDDLTDKTQEPTVSETHVPFPVTGKVVILVDDVIYTARTARCALEAIMKLGDAYTPIFQLKYLHGYSNPEIAKLLNIPSARLVSHRLGNGKMILMKMIGGDRYFENKSR